MIKKLIKEGVETLRDTLDRRVEIMEIRKLFLEEIACDKNLRTVSGIILLGTAVGIGVTSIGLLKMK